MCGPTDNSFTRSSRRPMRALVVSCVMSALAVLGAAKPAWADDPPQPPLPPRDYDAPDPNRNAITYIHAAANVAVLNYIIWQYDWAIDKETVYRVTGRDIVNNHTGGFPFDTDKLDANYLGHSIDGAIYHGGARATGLSFWETTPYVLGGALMWEMLSEYQPPSGNDMIATPIGGIALGEVLYRASSLTLDDSKSGFARLTRELAGFLVDPPRGANRLVTGEAWADGAPPIAKPARIVAHAGVDRVSAGSVTNAGNDAPSALVAIDAEYGDLLPAPSKKTIPAYDFFDFYAAGVITSQPTNGFELASLGLLHGWSSDVSKDEGAFRDNNVLGFFHTLDYVATNAIEFGGVGLGLGDVLVVRGGPRKRLRIGLDVEWVPLGGMRSTVNPNVGLRDYNFSTGVSLGLGVRWDIGRVGQLGLWAHEYATTVYEGVRGQELFGYARLWYEVEAIRDVLGVGMAPKLMHRKGSYTLGRTDEETQLSFQFYATLRL